MEEPTVIHHTFVLERSYPATPEQVFAAFADPALKRRWFLEGDHHQVEHHQLDLRVGGRESARLRFGEGSPIPGAVCTSDTLYQDIVPNRRLVFASTMALGDRRISAALGTVELLATATGTDLILTHQGAFFEGADGPAMREAGWRKLLDKLGGELPG